MDTPLVSYWFIDRGDKTGAAFLNKKGESIFNQYFLSFKDIVMHVKLKNRRTHAKVISNKTNPSFYTLILSQKKSYSSLKY